MRLAANLSMLFWDELTKARAHCAVEMELINIPAGDLAAGESVGDLTDPWSSLIGRTWPIPQVRRNPYSPHWVFETFIIGRIFPSAALFEIQD
jgi:hypothetical protein